MNPLIVVGDKEADASNLGNKWRPKPKANIK
jgi:hypothetical protein